MNKTKTFQLATCGVFAALLCIFGPLALPIGPVPISLATFVIYLAAFILGGKLGTVSVIVYILLGAVGLPVFSGYAGGLAKLTGPTGGYIIGYIPMAFIAGLAVSKFYNNKVVVVIGYILATAVLYLLGTAWFVIQLKCKVWYALTVCVFPFLIGDGAKIAVAIIIGMIIKKRIANLIEN